MKKRINILTTLCLALTALFFITSPLAAQNSAKPTAFLVYYDDDFELEVFDSSGEYVGDVFTGMELFPGSTIKTYNTTAEIQLDPNGSILKLSENSVFQIEAFQTTADESNDFSLFNGKLRVIAARAGLGYENYSIVTQSAVCGVRGTDFVIDSIGVVAVREGAVEFSSLLSGDTISVIAGQMADVFADTFKAAAMSAQSLASVFGGMDFKGTDPGQVPGHTAAPEPAAASDQEAGSGDAAPEDQNAAGDGTGDSGTSSEGTDEGGNTGEASSSDQQASDGTTGEASDGTSGAGTDNGQAAAGTEGAAAGGETAGEKAPKASPVPLSTGSAAGIITGAKKKEGSRNAETTAPAETAQTEKQPGPFDDFMSKLWDMLGFEIGSLNVEGTTYAKAVIQPTFDTGKFKAKLYIPVIYQDNLFDPESWYHPAGNDEYSFGTDQTGFSDIFFDVLNDLFLKINYIQYGDNGDDFYIKFGNVQDMTIGHGILMRDFSNNFEFPAVRKVGINTGFNFEKFGMEAVLDNAAEPTIFGGRLVYIPFGSSFPMEIGLSGITDINPDSELETSTKLWDPMILNAAFDIGLPIHFLGLTLFADAAALTMYDTAGWHLETFYNSSEPDFLTALNNYGIAAGVYGDIFDFLDYRFEYRFSKGIFTPSFYSNNYLFNKTAQYTALTDFIADPTATAYQEYTMGVYGELSANFFDAVMVSGGYFWPWHLNDGVVSMDAEDQFMISAVLMPDVIPVVGLHGSVTYTRTGLYTSIVEAVEGTTPFQLLDQATIFSGELIYPFDDYLDIALQFATAYTRDDYGNLQYTDGVLDTYFAMTVDMRVHF